jgi:hypothetical protein
MPSLVKLLLIDDDPSKRVVCDQSNRTARVVKLPRPMLMASTGRAELKQVGLYLLVGSNEDEPDRPFIYVGESEQLFDRLVEQDKSFDRFTWQTALVVVAQDASLNKAHAKHLEHHWYTELKRADGVVLNQTTPAFAALNEADRAIVDDFSATAQFLIAAIGFRLFDSPKSVANATLTALFASEVPRFVFETSLKRKNRSFGRPLGDRFVVETGSVLDDETKAAGDAYWSPVRKKLRDEGVIGEKDGKLVFLKEWTASSPSRAAGVAYGGSVNGLKYWVSEQSGETLKEWLARHVV